MNDFLPLLFILRITFVGTSTFHDLNAIGYSGIIIEEDLKTLEGSLSLSFEHGNITMSNAVDIVAYNGDLILFGGGIFAQADGCLDAKTSSMNVYMPIYIQRNPFGSHVFTVRAHKQLVLDSRVEYHGVSEEEHLIILEAGTIELLDDAEIFADKYGIFLCL